MVQVKVLGAAAAVLLVVSVAALVVFSHIFSVVLAPGAIFAIAATIAVLATPAMVFITQRPEAAARQNAERKLAEAAQALEAEIAAHRATEDELRQRADEIEYNHSFIETHAAEMVALAEQISAQKSDVEESKRRSDYTANHDLLTGLPNRRSFQNKLSKVISESAEQGHEAGLIYIDLNNFKAVNDKLGHERGDRLLQEVAENLQASLQPDQVAARLGGDEFAVIITAPGGLAAAVADLATELADRLKIDIETPEGIIPVGASLGFAVFPQDGTTATDILRRADQAMYAAKAERGARVIAYGEIEAPKLEASGR